MYTAGFADYPLVGKAPATLAVLIQLVALLLSWLALPLLAHSMSSEGWAFCWVLMQSLLSTLLCIALNMARWWRWIHAFFPLTVYVFLALQLPNELYLIGFCITATLFWTTFRSQVPFYPSRLAVHRTLAKIIPQHQAIRLIDIGSGLGDLSMYLANIRPESQIEGIEIAPLPWLISRVRALLKRSNARFSRGDYYTLNFADYDVVFAYLSPAAMPALWQKAHQEMRAGSLLMSYEFTIPETPPHQTIATTPNQPLLYVWVM